MSNTDTPSSLPLPRRPETMSDDGVTLGELGRLILDVQSMVHGLVEKLDRDYVRTEAMTSLTRRVEAIESNFTWLWRTVGGVIIVALLGLLITRPGGLS